MISNVSNYHSTCFIYDILIFIFYTIPLDKDGDIDNFVTWKDIRKVSTISKPRKSSVGNCQVIVETKEVAYERFYEENKVQILDSKLRSHKKSS